MSDLIETIIRTRKIASEIACKSLINIEGISEVELRERILSEVATHSELYPKGWYDPPQDGISVLFAQKPFARLIFNSMRNPKFWPNENSKFTKDTVGIVYLSPVDVKTGMLGDIAFTIYNGNEEEIKNHIRKCYKAILKVAKHAEVGMKFSDLYKYAINSFADEFKIIGEMTTNSDPNKGDNLGHTIPGSFEQDLILGNSFEEVRDTLRTKRIYINEVENFEIRETCAFTLEARLEDSNKPELPKIYFHFIVCFDKGEKTILENFENIFKAVNMDYIYDK
jgi:hypothetical protein